MPKPDVIELGHGKPIRILYKDRSVLVIDKPAGWMLSPVQWNKTGRNLQREMMLSIQAGDYWARARNVKYIRFVHRLDAETSGVLVLAKSPGALAALGMLFETRAVKKKYLAVVAGLPKEKQWTCRLKLAPDPEDASRTLVNEASGKPAETSFTVRQTGRNRALIEAMPVTGRTHQIRVHLAAAGHPILGDSLYGDRRAAKTSLALRAVEISYVDPFQHKTVHVTAPTEAWLNHFALNP